MVTLGSGAMDTRTVKPGTKLAKAAKKAQVEEVIEDTQSKFESCLRKQFLQVDPMK